MFSQDKKLYVAHSSNGPIYITGQMANRHGLIAGATGTGKTVSLQVIAETFSQAGVPCFMADMKGDLSGISQTGKMSGFIEKRCAEFGIEDPKFEGCPTRFYDVFGEKGFPMRTTVSAMGPQLLSRILDLNDTQEGVLNILFKIADDADLLLLDLKDLRMMLDFVGKNAASFTTQYGNISSASVGAIQRSILTLENQGGEKFFGEPAFSPFVLAHLLLKGYHGRTYERQGSNGTNMVGHLDSTDFILHAFAVQISIGASRFCIQLKTNVDVGDASFQFLCINAPVFSDESVTQGIECHAAVHGTCVHINIAHSAGQFLGHGALPAR